MNADFRLIDGPFNLPRPVRAHFQQESALDIAKDTIELLDSASETQPKPGVRYITDQDEGEIFVAGKFSPSSGPAAPAGTIYLAEELVAKANEERGLWLEVVEFVTAHEWGHAFASFMRSLRTGVPPGALIGDIHTLHQKGFFEYEDVRGPNDEIPVNANEVYELFTEEFDPMEQSQDVAGHTFGDSIGEHLTSLTRDNVEDFTYNLAVEVTDQDVTTVESDVEM